MEVLAMIHGTHYAWHNKTTRRCSIDLVTDKMCTTVSKCVLIKVKKASSITHHPTIFIYRRYVYCYHDYCCCYIL